MRRLSHVHATVHRQHSARNISGGGTCEEAGGIRDIIRLTQSAKRNLSGHGGAVLFGEVLRHIGIDVMQFAVTPRLPSTRAMERVKPIRPAFAAE